MSAEIQGAGAAAPVTAYHEVRRFEDERGSVVLMRVPCDARGLELGAEHRQFFIEFAMQMRQANGATQVHPCVVKVAATSIGEAFESFERETKVFVERETQKMRGQILTPGRALVDGVGRRR